MNNKLFVGLFFLFFIIGLLLLGLSSSDNEPLKTNELISGIVFVVLPLSCIIMALIGYLIGTYNVRMTHFKISCILICILLFFIIIGSILLAKNDKNDNNKSLVIAGEVLVIFGISPIIVVLLLFVLQKIEQRFTSQTNFQI